MLAAAVTEGGLAQYAVEHLDRTGLQAFADSVTEEVLEACVLLDTTKRHESSP